MNVGKTLFAQVMEFVPWKTFGRIIERHQGRISATMRQTHLAGEKLFVDWAGDTMPVFDPTTGEEHRARAQCVAERDVLLCGMEYANSKAPDGPPIRHANIRGRGYYH